ncbi:MAG: ABC transporter substrate-binding protein [Acidimicrobiales bacterium]
MAEEYPEPTPAERAVDGDLSSFGGRLSRRRFFNLAGSAGLLVAGGLVAEGCSSSSKSAGAPASKGKLVPHAGPVAKLSLAGGAWGYPSPFAYFQGPGLVFASFIFDSLIWKDSVGFIPWLATKWGASPDGLTWTFTLRDNVTWHDGKPLTASDVAFTYEYFRSLPPAQANIVGQLSFISGVATKGNVITVTLPEPYAPFQESVAGNVPIIPEHIWKGITHPKQDLGPSALIGSGPYTLASYNEAQDSYQFLRNDSYFLGKPMVKALDFVASSNELVGLRVGQLDGGSQGSEEGVPKSVLASFTSSPRFAMITGYGGFTRALYFNMKKGFPYDNKSFRQALAYGIDRKVLIERLLYGDGVPGSLGDLSPDNRWFASGLPTYPYNPGRAASLLDQAGLKKGTSGMRTLPGGAAFRPVIYTSTLNRAETAVLVLNYVRALGIDASVVSLDPASADSVSAGGKYEMMLVGYGGIIGDPELLRTQFSPNVTTYSFIRAHGYDNPEFTKLADEQVHEANRSKRMQMVHTMQHLLAEDVPVLQLYIPNNRWIYRTDIFDSWYFTPGGVFGGYPGTLNKQVFVTGKKVGD